MKTPATMLLPLALALLGTPAATAPLAAQEAAPAEASPHRTAPSASVQVENHSWLDMHVYALRDGERWSIGTVTSLSRDTLALPPATVAPGADVRFFADPIAGTGTWLSPDLAVAPGDAVKLTIENDLPTSTAVLLPRRPASR